MNTVIRKNRSKLLLASLTTVIGIMLVLVGMPRVATAQDTPPDAGPLVGDWSNIPREVSCQLEYASDPQNNYQNYFPAIGAAEHTDAIHSGVQPCAEFTGDYMGNMGNNTVFQHISDTTYQQVFLVTFDGPSAGYLMGGWMAPPPSTGQFVSKFDAASGAQIWKTQFQNLATSGQWVAGGSMAIHENGYLYVAAGPTVTKIDRDTGYIVAQQQQPILAGGAENANFDGMHFAPDNKGTILLKTQNRPEGCPTQGNGAMGSCQAEYGPQPVTTVVAVDPDTLDNIDAIALPQQVTARPIVTKHKGKIYIYMAGTDTLQRVRWQPGRRKLTYDENWTPSYLLDGQTTGSAPSLLGNWVISNQNAQGGSIPQCVVAVSQDDPDDLHRLCPWGDTLPEGVPVSQTLGSFGVDPGLSLIFAQDPLVGGVYAVSLDQDTGEMTVAWSRDDWTTSDYFSMIGPEGERIVISAYFSPDFSIDDFESGNYTEAVEWADAKTGETIARSEYNPSTAAGSLVNIGYGGRIYTMGNNGQLFIYQVEAAEDGDAMN